MSKMLSLGGMSADELESLAARATALARDLRGREPTYALALAAGVEDASYPTVRWGRVASYRGRAIVTMADGSRWECIGHRPRGDAETVSRQGWIEFRPLSGEPAHA